MGCYNWWGTTVVHLRIKPTQYIILKVYFEHLNTPTQDILVSTETLALFLFWDFTDGE